LADSYEGFAAVYERWAADMTEDVPFYVELAREADGPVVELAVVPGRVAVRVSGEHQEEPVPHTIRQVVSESRTDIELDSGARTSLWWATKNEWLRLIDVARLEVEALYGWFDRRDFDEESREFVWVTRKPAS
jgi:hypothetical protein